MTRRPAGKAPRRASARPARPSPASRSAAAAAKARCARADDIWPYLDDELTPARAKSMAAHIGTCETCGMVARRLCALLEECRTEGCRALPPDVRVRAQARVKALLAPRRAR